MSFESKEKMKMNEKTKKFINLKSITIAAVLIALLAIGSAIAFFTDKDNKTNDFTVGNISIQIGRAHV